MSNPNETKRRRVAFTIGTSLDGNGRPVQTSDGLLAIAKLLVKLTGGYTRTSGFGGWVNGAGDLVEEPVVVFSTFFEHQDAAYIRDLTNRLIKEVKWISLDQCGQQCILVEVTGLSIGSGIV